jgi:hypothetical protein
MKAQFDDMSSEKFQKALVALGATISEVRFGVAEIEFPAGTLTIARKDAFGAHVDYYLLPDGATVARIEHGVLGDQLYPVRGDDAVGRKQQILEANGVN